MAGRAAPLARTWYPCAIVLSRRPKRAPRASTLETLAQRILLATALEMGRLANEALARTGLGEAVVVGEARRGAELVGEVSMIVRGPRDAMALARALEGTRSCEQVEVTDPSTVRMRFEGGGPARLRIVPGRQLRRRATPRDGKPRPRPVARLAGRSARRPGGSVQAMPLRGGGLRRARRPLRPGGAARRARRDVCRSW